jgi:hypothetical protein
MPGFSEVLLALVPRLYARFPLRRMAQTAASLLPRTECRVQTAGWRVVSPASLARIALVVAISFSVQQSLVYAQAPSQPKVPVKHSSAKPMITGTDGSQTGTADFQGNFTTISVPSSQVLGLARETNCSLTLLTGNYSLGSSLTYTRTGITSNYDDVLHTEAGLTTTAGSAYPGGCSAPATGFSSRPGLLVGTTTSGINVFAGIDYSPLSMGNALFVLSGTDATTYSISISGLSTAGALIAGDLNGDGNGDLVVLNSVLTTSGSVSVLLGNADGTFQDAVSYPTAGRGAVAAVLDDINGDGKLDLVVVSASLGSTGIVAQQFSVLLGKGDGTFQPAQSFAVPTLPGYTSSASTPIVNIITADLRGDEKKDIICSNGLVMLGNGDGTFTPASAPAFPYSADSSSAYGPNLTTGDINKDGKQDVVVSTGSGVFVYLGNGDGTFTPGSSYASIDSIGFVTIDDLDGDGNPDIYVGMANGAVGNNGVFEGDGDDQNFSYALMGYGNGTFSGAPVVGNSSVYGAYTGTNLGDVNGDGLPDLVIEGTNSSNELLPTLTVELGAKQGIFNTASTVTIPTSFVLNGTTLSGANLSFITYAVGDIDGDGNADIVFLTGGAGSLTDSGLIYWTVLSNGDGTFAAPVPNLLPATAPSGDVNLQIAGLTTGGHPALIFNFTENTFTGTTNNYLEGFMVLPGNGNGTFGTPVITYTYNSTTAPSGLTTPPEVVAVADLNNDGKLDLLAVSSIGTFNTASDLNSQLQVFLGNGDGTFAAPTTVITAPSINVPQTPDLNSPCALADFNKDGKLDLACLGAATSGQPELAISLGNGDGTFAAPTILDLTGGVGDVQGGIEGGITAADFNGDGNVDLALFDFNSYSGILYGNGDGTFQSVNTGSGIVPKDLINLGARAPAIAIDLNGDGKPDILAGNTVLLNTYGTAVITLPTTTTALTASATTITVGTSVTFTATVTGASGSTGTPGGTVTFMDGTTTLGTGTLSSSGVATYATTTLPTGSDSITAVYGGSTSFSGSTSAAVTVTVTAVVVNPSFALSNSGNITVSPGATTGNTSTIGTTGSNGFSGAVSLSCAVSPMAASGPATCSLSPTLMNLSGATAQTSTLTITTTAATRAALRLLGHRKAGGVPVPWYAVGGGTLACVLLFGIPARRRGWRAMLGMLILLAFLTGGLSSCSSGSSGGGSGNSGTTAGTYTVTVTGTSGSTTETTAVNLTVN